MSFSCKGLLVLYINRELVRAVVIRKLVLACVEPSTALIPSVSRNTTTKSLHSRTVVAIQIPRVHVSVEWLTLKYSDSPSNWDRKYDFPVRYGPQIAITAKGFPILLSNSMDSGTICRSKLSPVDSSDWDEVERLFVSTRGTEGGMIISPELATRFLLTNVDSVKELQLSILLN